MAETSRQDPKRSILVIGGGIAGMSFAIRARELGHPVDLVEADPDWRVAGAGISITGPTYRAIKRLGLLDEVMTEGFYIGTGSYICAPDGTVVAEVPMQRLEPDLPTAGGILRPRLHRILSGRVRELGVLVRLGTTVVELTDEGRSVRASFGDGDCGDYDMVVGADGAFSSTRDRLFPDAPEPRYTGQYCWRMLAARPTEIDRPFFFLTGEVTAGLMPCSEEHMYLWLLENAPMRRRIDDARAAAGLRELLAPFGGPLGRLRDTIDSTTHVISRPLDALLLQRPWHKGKVVLIGDAAHATTPHLASGAGIAIEDALVLAECLAEGGEVEAIFSRFTERRWERCRLVVESSVEIGAMQQAGGSPDKLNQLMHAAQQALNENI
ncbi:FAD-dependent monooxygenase [Sphingomonas sp. VDB2]|uniref:FAD-dependent monooxygenase n=1 Tax=Sphingomonas sp. VDB2 TaxID=3228751 RepID=UPI003A8045A6